MDGSGSTAPRRGEGSTPSGAGRPTTSELLAAERAASRYWRSVAEQRRRDAATTTSRPLVRAAVALDRRVGTMADRVVRAVRRTGPRVALAVRATGAPRPPAPAGPPSTVSDIDDGAAPLRVAVVWLGRDLDLGDSGVTVVPPAADGTVGEDVDAVAVVGPDVRPVTPGWLGALAREAHRTGAAAAAVALHPRRRGLDRTPHDGRVRWAGLTTTLVDGAPRPVALGAGATLADLGGGPDAPFVAAGALVVSAAAWRSVGGIRPGGEPDAAVIDLCLRLGAIARPVSVRADVLVEDARRVPRPAELRTGLDPAGPAWRAVVAGHGAALRRRSEPAAPATFALTTAAPSARLAPRWGDWHLAEGLADGLRGAGHPTRCQVLPDADGLPSRASDVHVVVRGLAPVARTEGQVHVLWVVSHPEAVTPEECDEADLVLVASPRFAAHLGGLTTTPVEVLLQGTVSARFAPRPPDPAHAHPVTVVANSRGAPRRAVADALAAGLDVAVYGAGWEGRVPDRALVATHVANHELPAVYASAGVVLNDHWDTMREWGFLSNRLFDVAACGTPLLSDDVPGLSDVFGDLVGTWGSPEELRDAVDRLHREPEAARSRAADAARVVRAQHSLDVRARELLDALARHGLLDHPR